MLHLSINSFFRTIPLFESLDSTELSELLRHVRPFTHQPGQQLFAQGDESDGMYVVERGEVGVFACPHGIERVLLAELGNGAVIGELSLIDGSPRSATAETISQSSGYFLPRERFDRLRLEKHTAVYKLVLQLARTLEERRRVTERRLRAIVEQSDSADLQSKELRELFGRLLKG